MAVRVGDKIRVLKDDVAGGYERGNVFTVTRVTGSGDVYFNDNDGDQRFIDDRFYEAAELVADEPDRLEALEATVKLLTERITQMDTQLRVAREDIVLLEEALSGEVDVLTERVAALESKRIGGFTNEVYAKPVTKTLTRADVIEMAKKDVEELRHNGSREYFLTKHGVYCVVDWEINRKKRYVVVRMLGACSGNVYARGVAQYAPDDCFNVHIGKAIALRRALGLDIPSEYVNAPKPTEAQVGDIFEWRGGSSGILYKVNRVRDNGRYDIQVFSISKDAEKRAAVHVGDNFNDWWSLDGSTIVDDSHDFGGHER